MILCIPIKPANLTVNTTVHTYIAAHEIHDDCAIVCWLFMWNACAQCHKLCEYLRIFYYYSGATHSDRTYIHSGQP